MSATMHQRFGGLPADWVGHQRAGVPGAEGLVGSARNLARRGGVPRHNHAGVARALREAEVRVVGDVLLRHREAHGIGVRSIAAFAQDNGYPLEFSYDEGQFILRLVMPV